MDNFIYILGDNQFVDGRHMGNVRTEKSMMPRCQQRLLKEWDLSSVNLGKADREAKEQELHFTYTKCMNKTLSFTRYLFQMKSY